MPKKTFNILSIDGGGAKGLYSAKVVEQIEYKYGPIHTGFDLICGTSTGGLLGLGLSLDISATRLAKFYMERGDKIFHRKHWLSRGTGMFKQIFFNSYSSKKLRKEIVSVFGEEARMKNCKVPTCIFSYNMTNGMPIVFKSPHELADYTRDGDLPIVDVAMATASAPTYFRNHKINHPNLPGTTCTDGGVWCNNPALAGVLEARTHFVGQGKPFDNIKILSISTAPKPQGMKKRGRGLLPWQGDLMGAAIKGQSFFTHRFLQERSDNPNTNISYLRIVPDALSADQQKHLEMDLASAEALTQLSRLGTESGHHLVAQKSDWLDPIFSKN